MKRRGFAYRMRVDEGKAGRPMLEAKTIAYGEKTTAITDRQAAGMSAAIHGLIVAALTIGLLVSLAVLAPKAAWAAGTAKLKAASITLVTPETTSLTVKWKKVSSAKGYQVQVAPQRGGQAKTVTVKGGKKTCVTVNGLSEGVAYTVKVRAYRKVGGKTKYSKWSAAKSVTTAESVYSITYQLNGGVQAAGQRTSYKASDAPFDLRQPTREGYFFKGWSNAAQPGDVVTSIAKGTRASLTLAATWEEGPHSYVFKSERAPSCAIPGQLVEKCKYCGNERTTELPALGHEYAEADGVAATCTKSGAVVTRCVRCGDERHEKLAALGHEYAEAEGVQATCTEAGKAVEKCTRCGDECTVELPALGHNYVWALTVEATCGEAGSVRTVCTRCGKSSVEVLPATGGHKLAHHAQRAAGCAYPGMREYWSCATCGKTFSDEKATRSVSKQSLVIGATGNHTLCFEAGQAATCTRSGMKDHYACTVCKQLFNDADGQEPATSSSLYIGTTSHSYGISSRSAATCTSSGSETYRCTMCGKSYTTTIAAYGHNYVKKQVTSQGSGYKCTNGHTFTSPKTEMKLKRDSQGNYNYVYTSVCPTCGAGYSANTTVSYVEECSRCGKKK